MFEGEAIYGCNLIFSMKLSSLSEFKNQCEHVWL
jgi:hypothetical protein